MTSGPGGDRLYTHESAELHCDCGGEQAVDELAQTEEAYRLWTRRRAAQLGPINAGDPHPSRRIG